MTLDGGSTIYLEANSNITFISNYAYNYGGAIYYVDEYTEDYVELNMCFYGILSTEVLAERASLRNVLYYIDRTQFSIEFYNLQYSSVCWSCHLWGFSRPLYIPCELQSDRKLRSSSLSGYNF